MQINWEAVGKGAPGRMGISPGPKVVEKQGHQLVSTKKQECRKLMDVGLHVVLQGYVKDFDLYFQ